MNTIDTHLIIKEDKLCYQPVIAISSKVNQGTMKCSEPVEFDIYFDLRSDAIEYAEKFLDRNGIKKYHIKNQDFFTALELAKLLKVNIMTIYRYINSGKLTAYKIGKDFRINKNDFDSFLNKSKTK